MTNTTATITSRHDVVKALCTALLDGEPEGNLWVILPQIVRSRISEASERHDIEDQVFYLGIWSLLMATRSMAYRRLHATPDPQYEGVVRELNALLGDEYDPSFFGETVVEFIDAVMVVLDLANSEAKFGLRRLIEEYDKATSVKESSFEDIVRHLTLALICAYYCDRTVDEARKHLVYVAQVKKGPFTDDERAMFGVLLLGLWPWADRNDRFTKAIQDATKAIF